MASAILNAANDPELEKSKDAPHTIFLPMKLGGRLLKDLKLNDCSGEVLKNGEEWDTSLARETLLCATVPVIKTHLPGSLPIEFSITGRAQI